MADELWTSAKHMAQLDGKKTDWLYIISLYKSIGGQSMALTINVDGKQLEVLGEVENGNILMADESGVVSELEEEVVRKARKKFMKRDLSKAKPHKDIKLIVRGETEKLTIQKGVEWK